MNWWDKEGVRTMVEVYANLIIKGRKTIAEVPERIRTDVKQVLIGEGFSELAQED